VRKPPKSKKARGSKEREGSARCLPITQSGIGVGRVVGEVLQRGQLRRWTGKQCVQSPRVTLKNSRGGIAKLAIPQEIGRVVEYLNGLWAEKSIKKGTSRGGGGGKPVKREEDAQTEVFKSKLVAQIRRCYKEKGN